MKTRVITCFTSPYERVGMRDGEVGLDRYEKKAVGRVEMKTEPDEQGPGGEDGRRDDCDEWETLENAVNHELRRVLPMRDEGSPKAWAYVREVLIQGLESGAIPGRQYAISTGDIEIMVCLLNKGIAHVDIRTEGIGQDGVALLRLEREVTPYYAFGPSLRSGVLIPLDEHLCSSDRTREAPRGQLRTNDPTVRKEDHVIPRIVPETESSAREAGRTSSGLPSDANNNKNTEMNREPEREAVWEEGGEWIPPYNARYRRLLDYHRRLVEEKGYPPSELMTLLDWG